jgi:hypothetical protein
MSKADRYPDPYKFPVLFVKTWVSFVFKKSEKTAGDPAAFPIINLIVKMSYFPVTGFFRS